MSKAKRRLIEAISDRAPSDSKSLLAAVQREVWPFLKQIRRLLNDNGEGPGGTGGSPFDDHLVKARDADATTVGGLQEKSAAGVGIAQRIVTTGGVEQLETRSLGLVATVTNDDPDVLNEKLAVEYPLEKSVEGTAPNQNLQLSLATYPGPMTPDGQDYAGQPGEPPARGTHSHGLPPQSDPATVATALFPAEVPDPLLRAPVVGLLTYGEGIGFGGVWSPLSGVAHAWQFTLYTGQLCVLDASRNATIPVTDGDRIGVYLPGSGDPGSQHIYLGPYVVRDCGVHDGHLSYPVIQRASDADTPAELCHGAVFQIVGVPGYSAWMQGKWLQVSTADPIVVDATPITMAVLDDYTSAAYEALLTGPQLQQFGADSSTRTSTVSVVAGSPAQFFAPSIDAPPIFWTRGIGQTSMGAGHYEMLVKVRSDRPLVDVQLTARLFVRHADGSFDSAFLTFGSWNLTTPADQVVDFKGQLASAVSCGPTDELAWGLVAATTSATPVNVTVTWEDAARSTRLLVPFALPVVGASDGSHNHLSGRAKDVASTDPTDADACHPWSALGPDGRAHRKLGVATLTGSGTTRKLVMPADSSVAKLVPTTSEVIYGIDRTGFSVVGVDTSDEVRILVAATGSFHVTFVHNGGDAGADGMLLAHSGKNVELAENTFMRFARDPLTGTDGIWRQS